MYFHSIRFKFFLTFILLSIMLTGCSKNTTISSGDYKTKNFTTRIIESSNQKFIINIFNNADSSRILLSSLLNESFIKAAIGKDSIKMVGTPEGSFEIKDKIISSFNKQTYETIDQSDSAIVITENYYLKKIL